MRILYISHTHPGKSNLLENAGGMQRVSYQLVQALRKHADVQIQVESIHAGYNGSMNAQTAKFLLKMLFELKGRADDFNADIVLFSSMVTASLAPLLRNKLDIPLVTINHGRDVTLPVKVYQHFVPKIFEALDGVISVSSATRQQCIQRGMNPEKGTALPNGIDVESFTFPAKKESRKKLQDKFGMPLDECQMLLTVGRFVERKGHQWFIKHVFPKVQNGAIYVTIGDGPELQKVKEEAERSGNSENVFILGRQPDKVLKQAYAASDLFVMPNMPVKGDMEGFGVVMLEANLAETPVIASNLEGIKDVIKEGSNGYKVPVGDEKKFSKKINDLLPENLNLLSHKSRITVQECFSWTSVVELYTEYLEHQVHKYS